MKQNEYVFSLDGIATETYLNKKGYAFNWQALNKYFTVKSVANLNKPGCLIINNNKGSKKLEYCNLNEDLLYYSPKVINFLNEKMKRKIKFNPQFKEKVYKVKCSYLNTKQFDKTDYRMFFENPFRIQYTDKKLDIWLEHKIFFKKEKLKKYKLYKVIIYVADLIESSEEHKTIISLFNKSCESFTFCYHGITQRDVFQRFIEHKKNAENNTGYFFHKLWHKYLKLNKFNDIKVTLFILKHSDTLDEIYDYEEAFVEHDSLYPMGCNAIPGGHAGIRELHKLNLLGSTKNVSLKDRDKAIERYVARGYKIENRKSAAPHDRTGYTYFKPSLNRYVTVSKCRVNSKFDTGVYSP